MHKNYPSYVTKEQFENIRSILENSKKKTKPRNLDLYEVFCAILYVLKKVVVNEECYQKIFENDKLYIIIFKFEIKIVIKNLALYK